jgi:Zn-dependent protease with chaperone function
LSFFEEQDRARRATARLVVLYLLALLAIVAAVNVVAIPLYQWWADTRATWVAYTVVSATTLAVIALGSLEIVARLHVGEAELATLLAGRRVGRGVEAERRLINVVEEMAIASGLAAPPVYVLTREKGINAFAAGRSPNRAIVVVTAGALEHLTRDELQAVIAHEFSHIINGDIVLNIRAACVLQGVIFLAAIGKFMMRFYSGIGTEQDRRFLHLPLAALGLGIFLVGAIGVPFTRWIQAAISREREYLADASAVRYTRNADALCGALARIRAHSAGSRILDWHADAMAHMLFAAETHPPITSRIVRTNPHLPPSYYFERVKLPKPAPVAAPKSSLQPEKPKTIVPTKATAVSVLVAAMGEPTPESLEHAAGLLAYLPGPIREALAEPAGVQAVLLGCLVDAELTIRNAQLRAVGDETLARRTEVLAPLIASLDRGYRLPIVALGLPTLRKDLHAEARAKFLDTVRSVIQADRRVTLSEFIFVTILEAHLTERPRARSSGCRAAASECALVLSLLAHAAADAAKAFEKGAAELGLPLALTPREALRLDRVSSALDALRCLVPAEKGRFVAACAEVSLADGDVKLAEHELLRAVCSALDCPMPPALAALDARLLRK